MRVLKWVLLLLIMGIAAGEVEAQVNGISGKVSDSEGNPIVLATVRIVGTRTATVTDEQGAYRTGHLESGRYTVAVTAVGYDEQRQSIRVTEGGMLRLDFKLRRSDNAIEQVSVEGKTVGKKIKESGFNVNVIETKQYANTNSDVNQILNRSTGVRIREQGGLGSNYTLSVNGLSGNHVKFFIDDIPIEAYGSGMSFNNIPVNIIERIEVYKGAIPAHLTSDALGGAINIVTNRDKEKSIDFSYSLGSFNTHRATASMGYTAPKSGVHVNFNSYYNYSDNDYLMRNDPRAKVYLEIPKPDMSGFDTVSSARRFHDAYESYMGQLEVGVAKKKWADMFVVGLTYNGTFNELQTGATQETVFGHVHERSNSFVPSVRYRKDRLFIDGLSGSLFANFANDKSVVTDTSSYRNYRWNGLPEKYFADMGEMQTVKSIQHYSGYNNLIQAALNYTISARQSVQLTHSFISNYRKSYNEIDPYNHSRDQSNRVNRHTTGLNYLYSLFDDRLKTTVFAKHYSFGGKVTDADGLQQSESKSYLGFGLASSYFITKDWGVKVSYEHAYRLPTLIELYGNGTTVEGNNSLVPENSDNYNLGLFYSMQLHNLHRIGITAGVFYRNAKNYIHSTPALENNNGGTFRSFYNFGGMRVEGAEFEAIYSFSDLLRFSLNMSYESITDREKYVRGTNRVKITYKNRIPDKPWLYGNADLSIGKSDWLGKGTRIEFNWFMQFVNEYSYNWSKLGDKSTNFYIPSQWIQNAGLTYSINGGLYNFTVESRNLTDQIAYDNGKLQKPGRAVSLKVRYNLNNK